MGWWGRVKKKLKKPRALRNVLRIYKVAVRKQSRVVAYTAPIVGGLIWGPVGAAAGTAVSQAAVKFTGWKGAHQRKVRKQTLILGAGSVAAAAAYSVAAGAGAAQGPLHGLLWSSPAAAPAAATAVTSPTAGTGLLTANTGAGILTKAVGSKVGAPAKAVTSPEEVAAGSEGFVPSLLQTAVAAALGGSAASSAGKEAAGIVQGAEGALGLGGGGAGAQPEAAGIGGLGSGTIILIILAIAAFMLFKK